MNQKAQLYKYICIYIHVYICVCVSKKSNIFLFITDFAYNLKQVDSAEWRYECCPAKMCV